MADKSSNTTAVPVLMPPALPLNPTTSKQNAREPGMSTPARATTPEMTAKMSAISLAYESPDDTPTGDRGVELPKDITPTKGVGAATTRSPVGVSSKSMSEDDVFGSTPRLSNTESTATTSHNYGYTPRYDRDTSNITSRNMQAVCRPDALVFVANLPNHTVDETLEIECKNKFRVFGECFVKIKRDKNQQPFALIQFKNVEAAELAIQGSKLMNIDGREIRAEKARGNCGVVVMRLNRAPVTDEEARGLLGRYGEIVETSPMILPEGGYGTQVKFAYWQDARDALKLFRRHIDGNLFDFMELPRTEDTGRTQYSTPYTPRAPRSSTDIKSVFVGDLPPSVTEQGLREKFKKYGIIRNCNLIHKPWTGAGTNTVNCFAFIEYDYSESASAACADECFFGDKKVRVEPKEYSARRPQRLAEFAAANATPPRSSPLTPMRSSSYMPPNHHSPMTLMSPQAPSFQSPPTSLPPMFHGAMTPTNAQLHPQFNMNAYQTPPRGMYQQMQSPYQPSPMGFNVYSPPAMNPFQHQYQQPAQIMQQQPVYYPASFYNNAGMPPVVETDEEHES